MFIAIDMDKLKQINDNLLGHQEGFKRRIIIRYSTPQIAAQLPERIEKRPATYRAAERDRLLFRYLRDERKRYVT